MCNNNNLYRRGGKMIWEIVFELIEISRGHPNLRFGQLVSLIVGEDDLFYITNERILEKIRKFRNE